MEAFEAVRIAAATFHSDLTAAGADPDQPMALALAAVKRLDLELAWLPVGDPILKGAEHYSTSKAALFVVLMKETWPIGRVFLRTRSVTLGYMQAPQRAQPRT